MSLSPADKVSFLTLPSEIRTAIYGLCFAGNPKQISYPLPKPVSFIDEQSWQLLLVSKSVYRDALPEYYRTCLFGVVSLKPDHLRKLVDDTAGGNFTQYTSKLLVWRIPEVAVFESFHSLRYVKLMGILCGVELDPATGQAFTYNSLLAALQKARNPNFSWERCQEIFRRYPHINFTVDMRCDYWEVKLDMDGQPLRKWLKMGFAYEVRTNKFVEQSGNFAKVGGLVCSPL